MSITEQLEANRIQCDKALQALSVARNEDEKATAGVVDAREASHQAGLRLTAAEEAVQAAVEVRLALLAIAEGGA